MFRLVLLAAALVIGCHSSNTEPIIEEPGENVPLPPASGTAIGLLLDDTRLALRPEQADRLHEIDQQLETRNEALEAQARETNHPSTDNPDGQNAGRHGGGRHHRGGGAGANGRRDHAAPSAANPRIADEEATNTKDALAKALAALDPDQRATAETILQEHGVMTAP